MTRNFGLDVVARAPVTSAAVSLTRPSVRQPVLAWALEPLPVLVLALALALALALVVMQHVKAYPRTAECLAATVLVAVTATHLQPTTAATMVTDRFTPPAARTLLPPPTVLKHAEMAVVMQRWHLPTVPPPAVTTMASAAAATSPVQSTK